MADADRPRPAVVAPPTGPIDEATLVAWGRAVGASLDRPAIVALTGPLGAGKTTLARAIAQGAGVADPRDVTSPTYAIVHEYPAVGGVAHLDLYRLTDADALVAVGWDGVLDRNAVVLVEWPERAEPLLPRPYLRVSLDYPPVPTSADRRVVAIEVQR